MDIFHKLGISPYINAHDTYTIYGGSRMSEQTLCTMKEISCSFVDMAELQEKAGTFLAGLCGSEAAYVTNGAAGALQLCAAVCMVDGDEYRYRRLPNTEGMRNEILIFHCQHNCYDKAIEGTGAKIVLVGDADETPVFALEGNLGEHTAAVFYFPSALYQRGSLSLEETIKIAHERGVPVVVDAAAQLPPVENLHYFTDVGADMVIFSGGKTLQGPQDSGLVLGKEKYIADCRKFGAPFHGICRASKTSREAIAGLCAAVESFVHRDPEAYREELSARADRMADGLRELERGGRPDRSRVYRVEQGPVGQTYPRVFIKMSSEAEMKRVVKEMRSRRIYIGEERMQRAVYISPLNLTDEEADKVVMELMDVLRQAGQ